MNTIDSKNYIQHVQRLAATDQFWITLERNIVTLFIKWYLMMLLTTIPFTALLYGMKIDNNWLIVCSIFGIITAVSICTTITSIINPNSPHYSDSIAKRVLQNVHHDKDILGHDMDVDFVLQNQTFKWVALCKYLMSTGHVVFYKKSKVRYMVAGLFTNSAIPYNGGISILGHDNRTVVMSPNYFYQHLSDFYIQSPEGNHSLSDYSDLFKSEQFVDYFNKLVVTEYIGTKHI